LVQGDKDQGYALNYDTMADAVKTAHSAAEAARQAAVNAQEAADAWRKGTTPSSGPVSLVQGVDDRDQGYYDSFSNMANNVHTTHSNAEAFRQAVVN
jgi:hypothetical protein